MTRFVCFETEPNGEVVWVNPDHVAAMTLHEDDKQVLWMKLAPDGSPGSVAYVVRGSEAMTIALLSGETS